MKKKPEPDKKFETFVAHFIETATYHFEYEKLTKAAKLTIREKCKEFYDMVKPYLELCDDLWGNAYAQAGYDFFHTICGDGVGFWEDEWQPYSTQLMYFSRKFSPCYVSKYRQYLDVYFM